MNTITRVQFDRALALAAQHGHMWAVCEVALRQWQYHFDQAFPDVCDIFREEYMPESVGEIAAWTRQAIDDGLYIEGPCEGVGVPTLDQDGDIVHTTTSGRLTWYACREGRVYAEIARPAPNAMDGSARIVVLELHMFQESVPDTPGLEQHVCVVPEAASVRRTTFGECPLQRHYQCAYNAGRALIGDDAQWIPVYCRETGTQNGYLGALADERDPVRVRAAEAPPAACMVDSDGKAFSRDQENMAVARAAVRWFEYLVGIRPECFDVLQSALGARRSECSVATRSDRPAAVGGILVPASELDPL